MSRKFRYHAEPEEVKKYIEALGYQTEGSYDRDHNRASGFAVRDTTVQLSYNLVRPDTVTGEERIFGYRLVTMWEGIFSTVGDVEKLRRSRELYEKLYKRFRRR